MSAIRTSKRSGVKLPSPKKKKENLHCSRSAFSAIPSANKWEDLAFQLMDQLYLLRACLNFKISVLESHPHGSRMEVTSWTTVRASEEKQMFLQFLLIAIETAQFRTLTSASKTEETLINIVVAKSSNPFSSLATIAMAAKPSLKAISQFIFHQPAGEKVQTSPFEVGKVKL